MCVCVCIVVSCSLCVSWWAYILNSTCFINASLCFSSCNHHYLRYVSVDMWGDVPVDSKGAAVTEIG